MSKKVKKFLRECALEGDIASGFDDETKLEMFGEAIGKLKSLEKKDEEEILELCSFCAIMLHENFGRYYLVKPSSIVWLIDEGMAKYCTIAPMSFLLLIAVMQNYIEKYHHYFDTESLDIAVVKSLGFLKQSLTEASLSELNSMEMTQIITGIRIIEGMRDRTSKFTYSNIISKLAHGELGFVHGLQLTAALVIVIVLVGVVLFIFLKNISGTFRGDEVSYPKIVIPIVFVAYMFSRSRKFSRGNHYHKTIATLLRNVIEEFEEDEESS